MRTPSNAFRLRRWRWLLALAALTGVGALGGQARAATPECGPGCISVFSRELGTYTEPGYVEAVLGGGGAVVGQPVGLKAASTLDSAQDIRPVPGKVSGFYARGLVSPEVNERYGDLDAVQQEYAPLGVPTGLCVGLARAATQNLGLTLQPCTSPTTVWIPNPGLSPSTPGYFPIISGSTTDVDRPFAMHLPRNDVASGRPIQMQVRRLQFRTCDRTLPDRQLWGAVFGVLD